MALATEDYTGTNPKELLKASRRRYSNSFGGKLNDPLRDEVVDTDAVRATYTHLPIIPFFDNSDATLSLFRRLRILSPTAEACTNRIVSYSVGGGLRTVPRRTPGFFNPVGGPTEVGDDQDRTFREFVNTLNPVDDADKLLEEIEQLTDNSLTYGNRWLCVRMTQVGSTRHVYLDAKDSEHVRYWATNPGEPELACISRSWDWAYLQKYPPQVIGVYPNVTEDPETGDLLTIIHDRERSLTREWYGVPRNMGSIYWKYLEVLLAEFGLRGYRKKWTADTIIETSGDTGDEGLEDVSSFRRALESMYTNEGEAARFVHRHRLPEDDPISITQLKADTNHEFHESMDRMAMHRIVMSYDWDTRLLSEATPGKLGMTKEFQEIYRMKYHTVIKPTQERVLVTVNKALQLAAEWLGNTAVTDLGLGLGDMMEGLFAEAAAVEAPAPPAAVPDPTTVKTPELDD